jgi:type IV pilus assembly protein PilC
LRRFKSQRRIKTADITWLTRQLATLIAANIPIVKACQLLENSQRPDHPIQTLLTAIQTDLSAGLNFTQALQKHPAYFDSLFCNMVYAGEQSGCLEQLLHLVVIHQEKQADIKKRIINALTYPGIVVMVAILVIIGLMTCVIPQFQQFFSDCNADLPKATLFIIYASHFLKHFGWIMIVCLNVGLFIYYYTYHHTKTCFYMTHQLLLKIPLLGSIIRKQLIARFCRILSISFASGLPVSESLQFMSNNLNNPIFAKAIQTVKKGICTGQSIHLALQQAPLFPGLVTQMVAIGEESGTLEHMLNKVADYYEADIDHTINWLNHVLEPLIMTAIGTGIGGLVIAMYLPILKLGAVI